MYELTELTELTEVDPTSLRIIKAENIGQVDIDGQKTAVNVYEYMEMNGEDTWTLIASGFVDGWGHSPLKLTELAENEILTK